MGLSRLLQRKSGDATDKSSKRCKETARAGCSALCARGAASQHPARKAEKGRVCAAPGPREVQLCSNGQGRCSSAGTPALPHDTPTVLRLR